MSDAERSRPGDQFPIEELMTSSSIIFYHCRLEEGYPIINMSANVESILGYTGKEFATDLSLWLSRIHEEDREQVKAAYDTITKNEQQVIEFRFRHRQGHTIWLRDEIKLVRDNGEADSLIGSSIEITDQKQAERDLQNLNQTLEERIKERTSRLATTNRKLKNQIQYRKKAERELSEQHERMKLLEMAIDNINDMVVVSKAPEDDPTKSEIILVNEAFESFTGYSADEVIGLRPTFLHGEETSDTVLQRIDKQIENHEALREEFINYTKDGTPYWVELDMAPFPSINNDHEYWVGINRDVTKRKEAEQKLEESEQRYRALAELSFDAIFEMALDGTILNCNKRSCELFGYRRDELIGLNSAQLIPQKYRNEVPGMISESQTTDEGAWERTYQKKDGTTFPTEIHTQIYEVGGEERLVAYVRDNTARKEYENKIRKSLKEKETLLAEVHHRVKNNLAVISGLLEMQVLNTEDEKLLDKLQESQSRIQSIAMVHEKLYSSESFSEIQIDQYINDLVNMVVNSIVDVQKDITVEKDMEPVTLAVRQAVPCGLLLNELITNCYKHAFEGREEGVISISIQRSEDNVIRLRVSDNGVGLPDDFDIQSRSSLGMTLVATLVKQLDGELSISSDYGSCFEIVFEIE